MRSTCRGRLWRAGSRRVARAARVGLTLVTVLLASSALGRQAPSPERPQNELSGGASIFVDRSAETGFDFHYYNGATGEIYLLEIMGAGGGLVDFDNDGDLDIYAPQGRVLEPERVSKTPRHR